MCLFSWNHNIFEKQIFCLMLMLKWYIARASTISIKVTKRKPDARKKANQLG